MSVDLLLELLAISIVVVLGDLGLPGSNPGKSIIPVVTPGTKVITSPREGVLITAAGCFSTTLTIHIQ